MEIQLGYLQGVLKSTKLELYMSKFIVEDLLETVKNALYLMAEGNDPTLAHALEYDEKGWEEKYEQYNKERLNRRGERRAA